MNHRSVGSPLPEVSRLWKEGAVLAALCAVEAVYPTSVPFGGAELGWSWELGTRVHYAQRPWLAVLPRACCEAFWESGGSRGPVLVRAGGRRAAGQPLTARSPTGWREDIPSRGRIEILGGGGFCPLPQSQAAHPCQQARWSPSRCRCPGRQR